MAEKFEYYDTGDGGELGISVNYHAAQSCAPLITHTITSVVIKGWRTGALDTLHIEIKTGSPTGSVVASGTIPTSAFTNVTPGQWKSIYLGAGYLLNEGTTYYLVVRGEGGSDTFKWRRNASGAYPRGQAYQSSNGGDTFNPVSGDMMFQDWGDPLPAGRSQAVIVG